MSDRLLSEKRLAKLAYKERDFSKAVEINRSLLQNYGVEIAAEEAASIHLELGASLLRLGEMDAAAAAFAEAVRLDPGNELAKERYAEWSGKPPFPDETAPSVTPYGSELEFTSNLGEGASRMVDPLGSGAPAGPARGGVFGVPHAQGRPPLAWEFLIPILCVVGVCVVVIIVRSL